MEDLELGCKWYFAEALGGQDQGPNEAMSETFKKSVYASLVRESIQNSLDAQLDKTRPVEMEFNFKETSPTHYSNLFDLRKHITGCLEKYNDKKAKAKFEPMLEYFRESIRNKSLPYLEICDYNTTGMWYIKDDARSGFYSFVKCAGNSAKSSSTAGGSFGFGKAAYFNASKIRTIFVSTQTNQGKNYFEGVSSLCTHFFEEKKRVPVGFYTNNIDEEPIDNQCDIPIQFQREEPGTTVSIMGIDYAKQSKDDIVKEIIESVLLNFWFAIHDKKLVVAVENIQINSNNLGKQIIKYFGKDIKDSKTAYKSPFPYYLAVIGALSTNKIGGAENCVLHKNTYPSLGEVKLYMFKHDEGVDKFLYMRSPKMVVGSTSYRTNFGYFAVLVCDDEKGDSLLRDCENPAHNEWDARNNKDHYEESKSAMSQIDDFIQYCIRKEFASDDQPELNFGGLEDFLYIPYTLDEDVVAGNKQNEVGTYTGNVLDEGTIPTTTGPAKATIAKPQNEPKPQLGKVTVTKSGGTKPGNNRNAISGHTTRPRKTKGGGEEGATNPKEPREVDVEKESGSYAEPMEVGFRAYVKKGLNGELEHHIIIHTAEDAEQTQVVVLTGGDTSETAEVLKSARGYKVVENTVVNVPLYASQKNHLIVTFEDDIPHAIRLDVLKTIKK